MMILLTTLNNEIYDNKINTITTGSSVMSSQKWGENRSLPAGYEQSGRVTLAAGTKTISNDTISSSSNISLSRQGVGGTLGQLYVANIVDGTTFDIVSSDLGDLSDVFWKYSAT